MMHLLPGNTWGEVLFNVIYIYLVFTFGLTCYSVIRMYVLIYRACGIKYGKNRFSQLKKENRLHVVPLYSMEEIKKKRSLGATRLIAFPADTNEKKKFVIVCPGGGYAHCVTSREGYPIAARLNELGYTAFVLEYRTRFNCSPYAPMHDLARALRHIEEHQEEFGVVMDDYAICGFSAGGNLAGIFGSQQYGYEKYGAKRPGALFLGYPWTNVSHVMDHPYWNIWKAMIGIWLSERGLLYMFGRHSNKEYRESLCVQNWITEDFPPTYMYSGGNDVLVPASRHADVTADALKRCNVKHIYQKYFRLTHGIGLGLGTSAEGWLDEAVEFWEENCSK